MKFGLEFVPQDLYWKTTYYAIQAEKASFDNLWITDHFTNRNVYISLTTILIYTDRITVGTGVTNPYLVHPVVAASAIATLNEVAPGRVIFGIGAGDKTTLEQVGVQFSKPLKTIRETVEIIKKMTSGENLHYEGEIYKIPAGKLNFRVKNRIPIYIGAQGPKMLNLAGEIGDGVLINASHPEDLREAVTHIKAGLKASARQTEDLDIVAYTAFSIHKDPGRAFKAAVPVVAFIVAGCPDEILEKHGIKPETAGDIRAMLVKGQFKDAFSKVSSEMVDAFSVSGSPETCVEKISNIAKIGVSQFVTGSPVGPNVRRSIDLFASEVMPHFKEE